MTYDIIFVVSRQQVADELNKILPETQKAFCILCSPGSIRTKHIIITDISDYIKEHCNKQQYEDYYNLYLMRLLPEGTVKYIY